MHTRLQQIIQYKTGGRQAVFASLMGWTPQYLAKLKRGKNFGLQPVLAIATTIPEINLRWLLLGEGDMLVAGTFSRVQDRITSGVQGLLELERFIRFMSAGELDALDAALQQGTLPSFSPMRVAQWKQMAEDRECFLNDKFSKAIKKSVRPCKAQTAK